VECRKQTFPVITYQIQFLAFNVFTFNLIISKAI
jgi:hypothetical protein